MISRRRFVQSVLAASSVGLGKGAMASSRPPNVIFVTCFGGWDPTRVLVPAFDNPLVDMEFEAEPWTVSGLPVVDHPGRVSVHQFFEGHASKCAFMHGILTPSVAHMACLRLIKTGFLAGKPDWPSILAAELYAQNPLPHLCISGTAYPAQFGSLLSKTGAGGQLEAVLDGSIINWSDDNIQSVEQALLEEEQNLRRVRLDRAQSERQIPLLEQARSSLSRAAVLLQEQGNVDWSSDGSFLGDCMVAVDVLESGLSQCISITHPALWDSHSNNDIYQFWLWEDLFAGLNELCKALATRQGVNGTLDQETMIVVCSDMGRAPQNNSDLGKDHWPYSSAMFIGPLVRGGHSFGGYNAQFMGERLDIASGAPTARGELISAGHFGATLLAMMDVDWQPYVPNAMPLLALLEQ